MSKQSKYVWMNGALVDFQSAQVHFLTAGLHYGIGVFEGIRCYDTDSGPAVFRLKDILTEWSGLKSPCMPFAGPKRRLLRPLEASTQNSSGIPTWL